MAGKKQGTGRTEVIVKYASATAAIMAMSVFCIAEPAKPVSLVSTQTPAGTLDTSIANEVKAAINRSVDWLLAQQDANGAWSDNKYPALTAFAVQALAASGREDAKGAVDRGVAYIKSCAQTNGAIFVDVKGVKGGGLANYNTAICITALNTLKDSSLVPIIQNGRKFIAGSQHFGDDDYSGGFGYDRDTKRAYTDLLNTYYAAVAMRETASVEDSRGVGEKRVDIDWTETVKFVGRMQNKPAAGTNDAGGMFYNPSDPKAGAFTNKEGVVVFRSYGSMTYAGLLALIYANVSRDDVRVKSAFDWASRHWSLEENPGAGKEGLFFFYNVLTKSLAAYGQDGINLQDGRTISWRTEVAKKLVSMQQIDPKTGQGFWKNETGRYWEANPLLVTCYGLIALERL
jgi:squalene-hopene/tetraprenyl-beta-curcumene cyclase